jgi:hypothetical protein
MKKLGDFRNMDRRTILQHSIVGAGAAGLALAKGPARSELFVKSTKEQAGYLDRDEPAAHMCTQCVYFDGPTDCKVVESPISPLGTCDYYSD